MEKKENRAKIIFHIDMNQFFCSVACILDPSLRGKAFAIGRENSYKGVISTASYEARKYGIHSAMPLSEAYQKLPTLLVVNPSYKHYMKYHEKFIEIIKCYTNIIEVASIDELYADMTEISKSIHPVVLAKEIQARLLSELSLPCSIGIAPTLFLAKMASDIKKPLGVTVIRKRDIHNILFPLSVSEIFGIGKKTYPKLINNGIKTINDFMKEDNKNLILKLIGENAYNYAYNCLIGNSTNIVMPDRYSESTSISTSITFDIFKTTLDELIYEERRLTREIVTKLKDEGLLAKIVAITLRDNSFQTITRRLTLDDYSDDFDDIFEAVIELLEENYNEEISYRLVGVGLMGLMEKNNIPKEYNLFTTLDINQKEENINNLIKEFQKKYGENVIFRNKDKK